MSIGPGTRVGPYEVTALIGEGGMGKVWRAHHSGLKRDDALKVLPDAFASDPERLARFQREAQVLASLNHPNIARWLFGGSILDHHQQNGILVTFHSSHPRVGSQLGMTGQISRRQRASAICRTDHEMP
jgi:serine/threonine protein kinase